MMGALGHRIRVHALKAGTWPAHPKDVTLTEADIAQIAATYDPARFKAPVVIGHPQTDDPAWGWVEAAESKGDGLWLESSLTPEMTELVKARRYAKVSCALYPPGSSRNPNPGSWSLRHLGFLGAEAPAVKGLTMVGLTEGDDGSVEVTITADVELSEADEDTPRRSAAPPSKGDPSTETGDKHTMEKELERQTAELAERATALEAREAAVTKRERELRLASIGAEVDGHIQAGRVLPVEKPGLVALMELADGQTVNLSESETDVPAGQVLRGFLKNLPARVDLKERSAPEGGAAVAQAKAPEGCMLSERGVALDARARKLMAANSNLSYVDAVRQAEAEA